jgi:hypothetical protein
LAILNYFPKIGQVDKITVFTLLSSLGSLDLSDPINQLQCRWNYTILNPSGGLFGPYVTSTPAIRVNATYSTCPSPSLPDPFIDNLFGPFTDQNWALNTNASASLSITKNEQEYSNEIPVFFYPKPSVKSISPRLVVAANSAQIAVTGSNFQKSANAGCLVGEQLFPAEVISSTTALCLAGPSTLLPLIYQIKVLSPVIKHAVQSVEIWQLRVNNRLNISGSFLLNLEGFSTSPIAIKSLNSTGLSHIIQKSFPRVGSVGVNSSIRVEYDTSTGQIWNVDMFTVTFSSREDVVPNMLVDIGGVTGLLAGDIILVVDKTIGGSIAPPSIQSWSIKQSSMVREIQRVSISALPPTLEVQEVVLVSNNPITGFFTLSYNNIKTSLISHSATAFVVEAALRTISSIGDLQVTRQVANVYGFTWVVSFLTVDGNRPQIAPQIESLTSVGTSLSLTTGTTATGSIPFGGTFTLKVSGYSITTQLVFDSSALSIQNAIQDTLKMTGLIVTQVSSGTYNKTWDVTFPLSAGEIHTDSFFKNNLTAFSYCHRM